MKKENQAPEVLTQEEFNQKYISDNETSEKQMPEDSSGIACETDPKPKRHDKKSRFRIASFKDMLFLGALAAATSLTYTNHSRINNLTDCYFSRFTEDVCFVKNPDEVSRAAASYTVKGGSQEITLSYDSFTGDLSISQEYIDKEIAGYNLDIKQTVDAMFQNQENRYAAVNHVVRSMNQEEWRSNADYASRQIIGADKRSVQQAVINDILNNPADNESALAEIAEHGARLRPDTAVSAIPNDILINEGRKRGIDAVIDSYDALIDFLKSKYAGQGYDGDKK